MPCSNAAKTQNPLKFTASNRLSIVICRHYWTLHENHKFWNINVILPFSLHWMHLIMTIPSSSDELGLASLPWFSSSTCHGKEPLRIIGIRTIMWMTQNICMHAPKHTPVWLSCGFMPRSTQIGHFGNIPQANLLAWYPQANLLAWYGKTKPNTTKARIHQSKEMYNNMK